MIHTKNVKEIDFKDVGDLVAKHTGMHFNTQGAWNAPKDGKSFYMTVKHNELPYYYTGESSFVVFFDASPSDMTGYREEPVKSLEQLLTYGDYPDDRHPRHIDIPLIRCIEFLYWLGEIPDGYYVCVYKW